MVAEEEFMADNGYPGLRLHRLEHNSLYNFINVFLKPHIKEGFDKNEIIGECKRVFKYHIDKYDLPYALFLNERQNVA